MLGLLDRPTEGTVRLLGADVGALSTRGRAAFRNEHLGFVFQFHHLLPEFSVRENLLMPVWIGGESGRAGKQGRTAKPSAGKGGASAHADEILTFLGIGDLADKSADELSGGQKQRVAIGRALMNSPDILLADEPTGNLDTENSAMVYDLFRRIHKEMGTTFVIVTHDRAIARGTDRIIEVRDGGVYQDVRNDYWRRRRPSRRSSSPALTTPSRRTLPSMSQQLRLRTPSLGASTGHDVVQYLVKSAVSSSWDSRSHAAVTRPCCSTIAAMEVMACRPAGGVTRRSSPAA